MSAIPPLLVDKQTSTRRSATGVYEHTPKVARRIAHVQPRIEQLIESVRARTQR